jgi:4-hydroxy-4-methyl-2-oxoglutarate aldolase
MIQHMTMTIDTIDAARAFGTATLHEAGGKIGAIPAAIKPVAPSFTICGPAYPVRTPPGDNLWLHVALAEAPAGAVLIADCGGGYEYGYFGEVMAVAAKAAKLGGLVIDACVRDGGVLERVGFPIFARGLAIRGTGKDFGGNGTVNAPITIGGVTINPGDLVVGDTDGVVVIPQDKVSTVLSASKDREAKEAAVMERLRNGEKTLDIYSWREKIKR